VLDKIWEDISSMIKLKPLSGDLLEAGEPVGRKDVRRVEKSRDSDDEPSLKNKLSVGK
jgi:hypothetical protein